MPQRKDLSKNKDPWGLLAVIDLYDCDKNLIKSPKDIREFVIELCAIIDMKREGEVMISRFGEGEKEGYSMVQLIFESSITAHFDEAANRAFIDVFSCKYYDAQTAVDFCSEFFKAKHYKFITINRG